MLPLSLICSCSISLLSVGLVAQGGEKPANPPAPAPAAATPQAPAPSAKGDELRKAFVDADGSRRLAIAAAADRVLAADKAGREQFLTALRAIAAVAPKAPAPAAVKAPAPGAGTTPAGTPVPATATKPTEFADDIKKLMAEAVTGDAAAQKASLDQLAGAGSTGAAALTQLDERGKAILARCVSAFVRKKLETNAIFAGQYLELRDFAPEATELLLRWAREAPRDAANPEAFRTACLRALRDTLTADQATDRVRADLKDIAVKAQSGRNQDLFLTAVCALQQFGDAAMFDAMLAAVQKQAETGGDEAKLQALNMLAELHYLARKYEAASNHYKAFVAELEKMPEAPQGLPTMIYNTACSLALAGKADEALQYLEKALTAGTKSGQPLTKMLLDSDHDIESLRQDPRFQKLYEAHFGKAKPAK